MRTRIRAWRLRRATDKRDDLKHYLAKWGWALRPSELRRIGERIAKAEAKVQHLEPRVSERTEHD